MANEIVKIKIVIIDESGEKDTFTFEEAPISFSAKAVSCMNYDSNIQQQDVTITIEEECNDLY